MVRVILFILVGIVTLSPAIAQWDARSVALGNSFVQLPGMLLVGPQNPASLAWSASPQLVCSAVPAPFALPALRRIGLAIGAPLFGIHTAASITGLGGQLARRLDVRATGAFQTSDNMGFGASVIVEQWTFDRYGRRTTLRGDIGAMMTSEYASFGARTLVRTIPIAGQQVLESIALGATAFPSPELILLAELEHMDFYPLSARFGGIYSPTHFIKVYMGWSEDPDLLSGGISAVVDNWHVTFGTQWHAYVGWTHALGISTIVAE